MKIINAVVGGYILIGAGHAFLAGSDFGFNRLPFPLDFSLQCLFWPLNYVFF